MVALSCVAVEVHVPILQIPISRVYNVSISRSNRTVTDSCVQQVGTLLNRPSSISVPLDCSYARQRPMFCVQVTSYDCVSQVSTVNVDESEYRKE